MELKATRKAFLEALHWTQSTVERRNTMPILANVLIESHDATFSLNPTTGGFD
jgi:DNA polymerase III sliding clamp (beta) subunit (PCNA family)